MAIMRRGPLDRFLPPQVLKQAAAEGFDGSITFHRTRPVTFFFDGGGIYAASAPHDTHADTAFDDAEDQDAVLDQESAYLVDTVHLLVEVQIAVGGWYSMDPLGHHPALGFWTWAVADLLVQARAESSDVTAASVYGNHRLQIRADGSGPTTTDADALALVAELTDSATTEEVRARLDWNPSRLLSALMKLQREGLVDRLPAKESTTPQVNDAVRRSRELLAAEIAEPGAGADPPPGEPAEGSPEGAEIERGRRVDWGSVNKPANLAFKAWMENQIPEVYLDPLPISKEWIVEPEPPQTNARQLRRPRRRPKTESDP